MSTIRTDTLVDKDNDTDNIDVSDLESGSAKAWVSFTGEGTVTINNDFKMDDSQYEFKIDQCGNHVYIQAQFEHKICVCKVYIAAANGMSGDWSANEVNNRLLQYFDDSTDGLTCYGDSSCAESVAQCRGPHYINGNLAGQNSVFLSGADGVEYYFTGKDSGYGATIICQNGHNCTVWCSNDGCNNLRLFEQGGTLIINCNLAQKSDVCPNGYVLSNPVPSWVNG